MITSDPDHSQLMYNDLNEVFMCQQLLYNWSGSLGNYNLSPGNVRQVVSAGWLVSCLAGTMGRRESQNVSIKYKTTLPSRSTVWKLELK